MSGLSCKDLKAFANLLAEEASSSSDDDLPNPGISKLGPGDIKMTKNPTKIRLKGNAKGGEQRGGGDERLPTHPDDIWDVNDVDVVAVADDVVTDPRDRPEVDITYKQRVGSEDLFLQMNQRTPLTSSCEVMVVTVTMKGEMKKNVDCNLTEVDLDIRSPLYRLHLPFPHQVNPDTATAEWIPDAFQLVVTLQLVRELDIVNF
ncbi:hypothetical protein GE061_008966 [Apolygus lucorum]|uniref:PIH1D1/2/3 CS-like domain-containing protein n=1 Tax=Apolygus lucorum TaxID=248454 RepID=A0A6A4K4U4_APOLU|nr:hypothetical protein GE061_008966 [Apolygus lucorum]